MSAPSDGGLQQASEIAVSLQEIVARVLQRLGVSAVPRCALAYCRASWWQEGPLAGIASTEHFQWAPESGQWPERLSKSVAESEEAKEGALWRFFSNGTDVDTLVFGRLIAADLDVHDTGSGRTVSFASAGVRAGPYDFVAVVQFDKGDIDRYPSLRGFDLRDGHAIDAGLLPSTLFAVLAWFSSELLKGYRRRQYAFTMDIDRILRHAATAVMATAASLIDQEALSHRFDLCLAMNELSALRYEGSDCRGEILFAPSVATEPARRFTFAEGVPLNAPAWGRKLLELSNREFRLWSAGAKLDGLVGTGVHEGISSFSVRFEGQGQWSLWSQGKPVMAVRRGIPSFPSRRLDEGTFRAAARRVFDPATVDLDALWSVAKVILEEGEEHGALVVICEDAPAEASRLSPQATCISPQKLLPDEVRRAVRIDGALMLDGRGACHAIGVVLDGAASSAGSRSRGSRFNSAVRYVASTPARLALVRSEDGHVDLIPRLRPQVKKSDLAAAMFRLRSAPAEGAQRLVNDAELVTMYPDLVEWREGDERLVVRHLPISPYYDDDQSRRDDQQFDPHSSDLIDA
jgi:hypothetical protein